MNQQTLSYLLFAFCALVWGSSFILMKGGLEVYAWYEVGFLRIGITGICMAPFAIMQLRKHRVPLAKFSLVAISGTFLPAIIFAYAQTGINSSTSGVLNASTPLFTFILGLLFFSQAYNSIKAFGVVFGLMGSLIIVFVGAGGGLDPNWSYGLVVFMATLCYAFNANFVKTQLVRFKPFTVASVSLFVTAIPIILYLPFSDVPNKLMYHDPGYLGFLNILVLSAVGTALAISLFYIVVQNTSALFASSITYVIPVVALAWGYLDGEQFGVYNWLGMALIFVGVYLVRGKVPLRRTSVLGIPVPRRKRKPPPQA